MNDPSLHSYTGEFLDQDVERDFRRAEHAENIRQLRITLWVTIAGILMFGITDFMVLGTGMTLTALLTMRALAALCCLIAIKAVTLDKSPESLVRVSTIISILIIMVVIALVPARPQTLGTQLPAIIMIVLVFYLFIPNRPWRMLQLSTTLSLSFLLAAYLWADIGISGAISLSLLLLLVNLVGQMAARRINRLQRQQYAALLQEKQSNRQLQMEIEERKRLEQVLRQMAQVDDLTELHNRRHFLELAEQERRHCQRSGSPMALCLFDLDHFKLVNDDLGHAAGDKVLRETADLCRQAVRDCDIIGRFGGEEFVLALPDADADAALDIANRLRILLARHPFQALNGRTQTITLGLTLVKPEETSLEAALLRADQALYQGKHQGRNVAVFRQDDFQPA